MVLVNPILVLVWGAMVAMGTFLCHAKLNHVFFSERAGNKLPPVDSFRPASS